LADPEKKNDSLEQIVEDYQDGRISRRSFVKRGVALGVAVPSLAALLAACGGGGGGETEAAPPATEEAPPATEEAPPAEEPAPAEGEPVVGGTLLEGYDLDFSKMDPIATTWYDPGFFALYDRIITNAEDGSFIPQLAESWEFSPDGLQVTFKLRADAKFHSGRVLDATAIKEVYDTIQDPASGSPLRSLADPVASIDVPDPTTLVINLKHPYYGLLGVVETGYWSIVNIETRNELGAEEYGKQEIDGSGPFTFVEWVPGDHVTVKRWDDYQGSIVPVFQNKGTAYLDEIRWLAILEASQRAIQIENGEIDTLRGPSFQDVERLRGNGDLNVIELKEWSGYVMGPNFQRTQFGFDDVRVRQAISKAVDRQGIVDSLLFGLGEPLYGPVNTADKAYNPAVEPLNAFDLEGAKALMAEAGWTPGSDGILEKDGTKQQWGLWIDAETFNEQLGAAIQGQLKALGMDVKVKAQDRGTFFNDLFGLKHDAFMFFYLWPVPVDVVTLFVNSVNAEGAGPNWSNAKLPEIDAAIESYLNAATEEEYLALAGELQLQIATLLPIIPIVNRNAYWVHRKNVHGWLPHQWNLYPYYNDVWIEA